MTVERLNGETDRSLRSLSVERLLPLPLSAARSADASVPPFHRSTAS
jgi:hypothetical protein